jgi:ParB/RepB/Spo0J family partition protein
MGLKSAKRGIVDVAGGETEAQAEAREVGAIAGAPAVVQPTKLHQVKLEDLVPSPHNKRQDMGDLEGLAKSIAEVGMLQPIVARRIGQLEPAQYEIVFGHRRHAAAKLAGLRTVPVQVLELEDAQAHVARTAENVARKALDSLEEAAEFKALLDSGLSAEQIGEKVGAGRSAVYARLKLLDLGKAGRDAYLAGQIPATVAEVLARLPPAIQDKATKAVLEDGRGDLTFRGAKDFLEREYMLNLERAKWDLDDAQLVPAAGSCRTCPKRTAAQPELFAQGKHVLDLCMDKACFALKGDALWARKQAEAKEKNIPVMAPTEAREVFGEYGGLSHDSGFVELSDTCRDDKKSRTYKSLLGKSAKELVVLARNPKNGEVVELLPKKGLTAALKEAGRFESWKEESTASPAEKKKRAEEKAKEDLEGKVEGLLVGELVAKVEANELDAKQWRWLLLHAAQLIGDSDLIERRQLGVDWLDKWIPKATEAQLRGAVVELLVGDHYATKARAEACELWKVDRKKLEQAVKEEADERGAHFAESLEAQREGKTVCSGCGINHKDWNPEKNRKAGWFYAGMKDGKAALPICSKCKDKGVKPAYGDPPAKGTAEKDEDPDHPLPGARVETEMTGDTMQGGTGKCRAATADSVNAKRCFNGARWLAKMADGGWVDVCMMHGNAAKNQKRLLLVADGDQTKKAKKGGAA